MSPAVPDSNRPDVQFGRLLRELRERARPPLSQNRAAQAAGLHQGDVSKLEKGAIRITEARVRALLGVYAEHATDEGDPVVTPEQRDELIGQARTLEEQLSDRRIHLQTGNPLNTSLRTRAAEDRARLVRSYQPLMILGVLQTRDYAGVVFGGHGTRPDEEVERLVEARLQRWTALMSDPSRRWVLLQTEWAARVPIRSYGLQAAQLRQLLTASELPNVELGVIPLDVVAPYPVTVTGFHLYDDSELIIGTDLGVLPSGRAAHIDAYVAKFETLRSLAIFDEPARALLRGIERDYRARADT